MPAMSTRFPWKAARPITAMLASLALATALPRAVSCAPEPGGAQRSGLHSDQRKYPPLAPLQRSRSTRHRSDPRARVHLTLRRGSI